MVAKIGFATLLCIVLLVQSGESTHVKRQSGFILIPADDAVCHPEPTEGHAQNIIGYGTLIDEESKTKFYPEAGESIPIRVGGFGRHWNLQKPTLGFGATYLGAIIDLGATFNAVAFSIPPGDNVTETLRGLDERQSSFCRQRVDPKLIMSLGPENKTLEEGDYWTYVTRTENSNLPNPTYPIVQSVVDTFIIGCLDIGKKHNIPTFAQECVQSTYGWESTWVNDRVYPRTPLVKQPRAQEIDNVLAIGTPLGFSRIAIE